MPKTTKQTEKTFNPKQVYQDVDGTWMTLAEVLREFTELRVVNRALNDVLSRHKIAFKEIDAATYAAKQILYGSKPKVAKVSVIEETLPAKKNSKIKKPGKKTSKRTARKTK